MPNRNTPVPATRTKSPAGHPNMARISTTTASFARAFSLCAVVLVASPAAAQVTERFAEPGEEVTASHVYQATTDVIAEIRILRGELGANDYPVEAEQQEDRAPVHVYSKTLEVMGKVSRLQRRLGLQPAETGQIPIKEIVPRDVLESLVAILVETRRIKEQMVIETQIEPAAFVGGKTPSMVYKSLADASFLLDGLIGRPLTPSDVFWNTQHILDELELIAAKLRVPLEVTPPSVEGSKTSKDVAQQVLRASYKVVNLQTRLGMAASSVPQLTLVRVTPSEVFDATSMLLAEMSRIKVHLDINVPRDIHPEPRMKTPTDVFAQILLIIRNLDLMTAAAA